MGPKTPGYRSVRLFSISYEQLSVCLTGRLTIVLAADADYLAGPVQPALFLDTDSVSIFT
jgi:hypothetical protein